MDDSGYRQLETEPERKRACQHTTMRTWLTICTTLLFLAGLVLFWVGIGVFIYCSAIQPQACQTRYEGTERYWIPVLISLGSLLLVGGVILSLIWCTCAKCNPDKAWLCQCCGKEKNET